MNEVDKRFDKEFVDKISGDMWQTTSREDIKSFIHSEIRRALNEVFGKIIVDDTLVPNQVIIMRKEDYKRIQENIKKYLKEEK